MPMEMYNEGNAMMGIQELPAPAGEMKIHRMATRDIPDLGEKGLKIIHDIGTTLSGKFEGCTKCGLCVKECPEHALSIS